MIDDEEKKTKKEKNKQKGPHANYAIIILIVRKAVERQVEEVHKYSTQYNNAATREPL